MKYLIADLIALSGLALTVVGVYWLFGLANTLMFYGMLMMLTGLRMAWVVKNPYKRQEQKGEPHEEDPNDLIIPIIRWM